MPRDKTMSDNVDEIGAYKPIASFNDWMQFDDRDYSLSLDRVKKLKIGSAEKFDKAATEAMRWAAIETGAIEGLYQSDRGFTFSVATQANLVEIVYDRKGEDFALHLSAHLKAYEYILDFVTGRQELALAWIRELHVIVCEQQEYHKVRVGDAWEDRKLNKGMFKETPNSVHTQKGLIHHYCPVDEVHQQMQFMVDQTQKPEFQNASGVAQAAYVHHVFAQIHPFSDGNGRVARALASIFLYKHFCIPMVIFSDQRDAYFSTLEAADDKSTEGFFNFMEELVEIALEMIEINIRNADRPSLSEQTKELSVLLRVEETLRPSVVLELSGKLLKLCTASLAAKCVTATGEMGEMGKHVQLNSSGSRGSKTLFRPADKDIPAEHVASDHTLVLSASLTDVVRTITPVSQTYVITTPKIATSNDYLCLILNQHVTSGNKVIKFRIDELTGETKASTKYKIEQWCESAIAVAVQELITAAG